MEFVPISEAIKELSQWKSIEGRTAIQRKFRFKDFPRAWSFLTEIAINSMKAGIYPEINNKAERVTLVISGEDFSLSGESVELAKMVDSLLPLPEPPGTKSPKKVPSKRLVR